MPTSSILRFCLCSVLSLCLAVSTTAQRSGRKRMVSVTTETIITARIEPKSLIDTASLRFDATETENDYESTTENILSPQCRETKQVNISKKADAYPYITEDGLRLYFTSNREGGHGRFFISTRKSLSEPFGEPKVLSKHLTDGYYAGTLTADELTLCMVMSGDMYISVRKNLNEEFPIPVKITGTKDEHFFGPSISPDGKEIAVTVTIGEKDRTWLYKRTGTYQVASPKELSVPVNSEPGPGQLSKDGLSYYLSIETKGTEHLWKYSRASVADDFSNPEELPEQMKGLKCILQPSLNSDGSVLVFVTSNNNLWDDDEILLVNRVKRNLDLPKLPEDIFNNSLTSIKTPEKINSPELLVYSNNIIMDNTAVIPILNSAASADNSAKSPKPASIAAVNGAKLYPNPFVNMVYIEINNLPGNGALLNIYDISGKKIRQQIISSSRTSISLEQLVPGVYMFEIVNRKGQLISNGKLVKAE